jgi:xylose dehydrogenase (NAD/NADP)
MTLRWGLLSTAKINDRFLAGCADSDQMEVTAVASRDAGRARRYAQEHRIRTSHGTYEALLEDQGVDAVYVSLPNGLHLEWSERALRAGKHVLCEKPMGRDPAAVAAAFDVAAEHERVLMEAFMYRHHPQTRRVTELVAQGAVGALRLVRAAFSFPLSDQNDVRLSRALDGGALMDVGCYCVSAARLLAGEPAGVSAEYRVGGDGVDVGLVGSLRFGDGTLGVLDCGLDCATRDELEVVGEEGSLFLDDPWHCRTPVIEHRSPTGVERIQVAPADSYRLQAENFAAAVRGQAEPLLSRADAVGQAATIAALYAAADSGRSEAPGRG